MINNIPYEIIKEEEIFDEIDKNKELDFDSEGVDMNNRGEFYDFEKEKQANNEFDAELYELVPEARSLMINEITEEKKNPTED